MEKSASGSKPNPPASEFLPAEIESLPPILIQKAEEELGETPASREAALMELKRLIKSEKDFHPRMDNPFLLRFLRTRKFNARGAFKMVKNFYLSNAKYSRVLANIWPSEVKHVFDMHWNMMMVLPYRDREGCIVGVGNLAYADITKVCVMDIAKALGVCIEYILGPEATQICGVVLVVNLKGIPLKQMRHFLSYKLFIPAMTSYKDCVPLRLKAVHFINEPPLFNVFVSSVKKMVPGKIITRIYIHGEDINSLHKYVPPEILPEEFGGQQGPIDSTRFVQEVLEMEDYFTHIISFGYKKKTNSEVLKMKSVKSSETLPP